MAGRFGEGSRKFHLRPCQQWKVARIFCQVHGDSLERFTWKSGLSDSSATCWFSLPLQPGDYFHFPSPGGSDGNDSACNAGDPDVIPGSERSLGERKWLPTPVFLTGEFCGQRSLVQRVRHDWVTNTSSKLWYHPFSNMDQRKERQPRRAGD